MDVTSLLNRKGVTQPTVSPDSLESTPAPSIGDCSTADLTAASTTIPEKRATCWRLRSSSSSRHRTPWDAGGYTMPLSLEESKTSMRAAKPVSLGSKYSNSRSASESSIDIASETSHSRTSSLSSTDFDMTHSQNVTPVTSTHPVRPIYSREDGEGVQGVMALPRSPKHKFSDSHSSLSSFASSTLQSGCHSRISSLSTVSGGQPFSSMLNDLPSFETKLAEYNQLSQGEGQQRQQKPPALSPRINPAASVTQSFLSSPVTAEEPQQTVKDPARPHSPSDAILITRGVAASNRSSPTEETSPHQITINNSKQDIGLLNPNSLQDSSHSRTHKRTVSAPDFGPVSTPTQFQPFPSVSETPSFPSYQNFTMPGPTDKTGPGPGPGAGPVALPEIKCMYIENCDTGSQPRKAISHIFGRNKLCTRMIPAPVWVHYCRKHYQRSRYRNGHEYAKLQIDLVVQQIERVQTWSEQNKKAGKPGFVNSWSLAIRKREQKRLDDKQGNKGRGYDSDDENAVMNGTAVPDWLLQRCGTGYSTEAVMDVVQRLKTEIHGNQLSQIPDIEILPSISTDGAEERPKAHLKRKTSGSAASHKRSQSMGTALRQEFQPTVSRHMTQPSNYWDPDNFEASVEKRARVDPVQDAGVSDVPRAPGRPPIPAMRRMQLTHRPAFDNIREHQPEEYHGRHDLSSPFIFGAGGGGGPPRGPLPAPSPQRHQNQSMATHLEAPSSSPNHPDPRRSYHQRSQSEAGYYYSDPAGGYRIATAPSSEYPTGPFSGPGLGPGPSPGHEHYAYSASAYSTRPEDSYFPPSPYASQPTSATGAGGGYYDEPASRQYGYTSSPAYYPTTGGMPPRAAPPAGGARHGRHQSSPSVSRVMPHRAISAYDYPGGDIPPVPRYDHGHDPVPASREGEQQQQQHQQQQHYITPTTQQPPRTIVEDEAAKSLYASRR